ncbi:MAG: Holliday junction resolvase RuvX [Pseudomonadota bacterium]
MVTAGGVVLAIDYGHRRVGLATGHPLTGTAQPLKTITHSGDPYSAINRIIDEWRPNTVVVGLPLTPAGDESDMSRAVRAFVAELETQQPRIDFVFHDERYSSQQADAQFKRARQQGRARRSDAANLDSHAAAVILESWLASQRLSQ